jgi:chromatin structure-remodeling complex subunit SFH1
MALSTIHLLIFTSRTQESLEIQAQKPTALVPIRVEFETDTHRIRDCFVWNLYENLIKPETFARIFCHDLDLPLVPWADTVANQIKAQLEDHEGVASMDFGVDGYSAASTNPAGVDEEVAECRVILSVSFNNLL